MNDTRDDHGQSADDQPLSDSEAITTEVGSMDNPLGQLDVAAIRGHQMIRLAFFLDADEQFILLGEGRTAKVYLGAIIHDAGAKVDRTKDSAVDYVAVKCLLTDENEEYKQQIRARFKTEMAETAARGGPAQESFVEFVCQGRIDPTNVPPEEENEDLTVRLRQASKVLGVRAWPQRILQRALDIRQEKLEGSFYAMQLCQGSLLDILESSDSWDKLSCYEALQWAQTNVRETQETMKTKLAVVVDKFLQRIPPSWSGYEILNAFKDSEEANGFRGRVVLQLAANIAELVSSLHNSRKGVSESLAHRDLKPGNILVRHPLDRRGLLKPVFRLSDLGYVVERKVLEIGAQSIRLDSWRTHHVPGSQFYRAPEQWTLPVEVRMRMFSHIGEEQTSFQVLSSRLDSVEQGDFLTLPTKYLEVDDGRLKTITGVTRPNASPPTTDPAEPRRQLFLTIAEKAKSEISHDIVAHIVKASGFHTDGFSFGAILYDLATGGKNPEHFYFYCLHRYQVDWEKSSDLTVQSIVAELQELDAFAGSMSEPPKRESGGPIRKMIRGVSNFVRRKPHAQVSAQMAARGLSDPSPATKEPTYAAYLRDERGVDIPGEILLIICKCMLRGYRGCYYSSALEHGWTADDNVNAFDRIVEDINELIGRQDLPFYLPQGVPAEFQNDTLILLRCLGLRKGMLQSTAKNEEVLGDTAGGE